MDVCLKDFFRPDERPRFQTHLRTEVNAFATDCIETLAAYARDVRITRILPRHVPVFIFQLCCDPLTYIDYDGEVRVHKGRTKELSKIMSNVLAETARALESDGVTGVERKAVNGVAAVFKSCNLYCGRKSATLIAACVLEVLGMILRAAHRVSKCKTLTPEIVWEHGGVHVLSTTGERCVNCSLARFLAARRRPRREERAASSPHAQARCDARRQAPKDALEEKSVSFSK